MLPQHCPQGIYVFFDNVGGGILDAVLTRLALGVRIVICGANSHYNNTSPVKGPVNYLSLLVNRVTMKGIVVSAYYPRAGEAIRDMAGWLMAGKLKTARMWSTGCTRSRKPSKICSRGRTTASWD